MLASRRDIAVSRQLLRNIQLAFGIVRVRILSGGLAQHDEPAAVNSDGGAVATAAASSTFYTLPLLFRTLVCRLLPSSVHRDACFHTSESALRASGNACSAPPIPLTAACHCSFSTATYSASAPWLLGSSFSRLAAVHAATSRRAGACCGALLKLSA